uniref:Uncharacterized protein n=1 Tax=Anguilla anguilla TaxID=7936 RepID=A0A0E9WM55_ANGAN
MQNELSGTLLVIDPLECFTVACSAILHMAQNPLKSLFERLLECLSMSRLGVFQRLF